VSSNNNSTTTSAEHLDSECCHLLATNCSTTTNTVVPGYPKAATPPHKLCLETSFTSLQSPSSDVHQNPSLNSSTCSQNIYNTAGATNGRALAKSFNNGHPSITSPFALHPVLSWEYASLLEEQLLQSFHNSSNVGSSGGVNCGPYPSNVYGANSGGVTDSQKTMKVDLIHDDWFGLAPLATPESLSEVSSISSRASSLMLNIDRTLKDMFGHHRGCLPAYVGPRLVDGGGGTASPLLVHAGHGSSLGVSYLNSKSPRFLRTSNGISGLVNINSRVPKPGIEGTCTRLTNSSSGDEDLSFESAQQHISSDDGNSTPDNCNHSNSEVFVSVKGTPFSSADSVTVNVDVHCEERPHSQVKSTCSPLSQPLHCSSMRFLQPHSLTSVLSPTDTSVMIISSSPKQVKFLTPQSSKSDESAGDASESPSCQQDATLVVTKKTVEDGRTVLVQNNDNMSNLEGMMILHLDMSSNYVPSEDECSHTPARERLPADIRHNLAVDALGKDRQEDPEIVNQNIMHFVDSINALKPSFPSTDTSPVTDDSFFCSSSIGNNNIRNFQQPFSSTENTVLKKEGNIMSSPLRNQGQVLQHMKDTSAALCSSGVESGLVDSKRKLPDHETSMAAHLQAMESLPLLSKIGEVHDKAAYSQKKYVYPVTSVGKGESSV